MSTSSSATSVNKPVKRPGGASLQMDILDLNTALERNTDLKDGRLRASIEAAMRCAQRPDLETAAATPPSFAEPRLIHASKVRVALAACKDPEIIFEEEVVTAAATIKGESTTNDPTNDKISSSYYTAQQSPLSSDTIPLLLGANRCDLGSTGCRLLASVLPHKVFMKRLVFCDLSSNAATDLGKDFGAVAKLCESLGELPHLAYLSLHGNILLAPGCASICRMLRSGCKNLRYLDLSRCNIGHAGAYELLPAFERTVSPRKAKKRITGSAVAGLLSSDSKHNENDESEGKGDDDTSADDALLAEKAMEAALEGRTEEFEAALAAEAALAEANQPINVLANKSLVWLDMSENNLCGFGLDNTPAISLVSALIQHTSLRHLDLSRNRLARPVVTAIAESIESNTSIKSLSLDENAIDAQPAAHLARSLVNNTSLHTLSMRYNRLRSDGASAFAHLLRHGHSIKRLDIRGNYIGDLGQRDIKLAMEGKPPPPEVTAFGANLSASLEGADGSLNENTDINIDGGFSHGGPQTTYADSIYDDTYSERPSTAASISVDFDNDEEGHVGGSRRESNSNMMRSASATAFAPLNGGDSINDPSTPSSNSEVSSRPETVASNAASAMSSEFMSPSSSSSSSAASARAGGGDMMAFYASASKEEDEDDEEEEEARRRAMEVETKKRIDLPSSSLINTSNPLSATSPSRAAQGTGIRAIKALQAEEALATGNVSLSTEEEPVISDTNVQVLSSSFFVDVDNSWVDRIFTRRVLVVDPATDNEKET
jgi:hypothetical protein